MRHHPLLSPFAFAALGLGSATAQIPDATGSFLHLPSAQVGGGIRGLAVAGSGLVYVADGSATVTELDLSTGAARVVLAGLPLSTPGSMLLGDGRTLTGNDLVLADWNTEVTSPCCDGRVLRIDPGSGAFTVLAAGNPAFATVGDPGGVALGAGGAWGDFLYVMDFEGASPNPPVLYRVDAAGTATTFLVDPAQWTTSQRPRDLAFGSAAFGGDLFVADPSGGGRIWRVGSAATLTPFVSGYDAQAIAASSGPVWGDHLYFTAQSGSFIDLLRTDPAGLVELVVDDIGPATADTALCFRPDGKALHVGVGDRLFTVLPAVMQLVAAPDPAFANQTLHAVTSGGFAGKPALLLADRLLALRFEPPAIVAYGGMNAAGGWDFAFPVPAGLAGIDVRIQTLSLDTAEHYLASNKSLVRLR